MRPWLLVVLLASCATREEQAAEQTSAALARLPTCAAGVAVGEATLEWVCTRMACPGEACCNRCGHSDARAREVLDVRDSLFDCEALAVDGVLKGVALSFSEPPCVAR